MSNSQNTDSPNITDESLSEYLRSRYLKRSFDDFSRLLSELVIELRNGGFNTIDDVHKTLERTREATELFEAENPPSRLVGSRYSAIGFVRISMLLLDNNFFTAGPMVVNNALPERLEEYRKHILPEIDES